MPVKGGKAMFHFFDVEISAKIGDFIKFFALEKILLSSNNIYADL